MRISAPLLTLVGTVAGTAVAVVAYQSAASVGAPPTEPAADKTDTSTTSTTTWLPCERGWKLADDVCVRIQEKVVVVPDLPAQAAAPARSAGVRSSGRDDPADEANEDRDHAGSGDDAVEDEADDDSGDDAEHAEHADHADEDGSGHEDVGDDD